MRKNIEGEGGQIGDEQPVLKEEKSEGKSGKTERGRERLITPDQKEFIKEVLPGIRFGLAAGATLDKAIKGAVRVVWETLPQDFRAKNYEAALPVHSGSTFDERAINKIKEEFLKHISRLDERNSDKVEGTRIFDLTEEDSQRERYTASNLLSWIESDYK